MILKFGLDCLVANLVFNRAWTLENYVAAPAQTIGRIIGEIQDVRIVSLNANSLSGMLTKEGEGMTGHDTGHDARISA